MKQHIIDEKELFMAMLMAYKCGGWMNDNISVKELGKRLSEFSSQTGDPEKEDLEACALIEEIIKNILTIEVNQN